MRRQWHETIYHNLYGDGKAAKQRLEGARKAISRYLAEKSVTSEAK